MMHYRRAACALVVALALVGVGTAHAATDDPLIVRYGTAPLSADDEHALRVQQRAAVDRWNDAVADYMRAIAYAIALEDAQRAERAARAERAPARRSAPQQEQVQGSGRCGGDLPPCYVMERESGGSLTAQNPTSTASGKWQFLDSTWHSVTGLPGSASDYDEATQDAAAAEAWAGGAGCSHWSAC